MFLPNLYVHFSPFYSSMKFRGIALILQLPIFGTVVKGGTNFTVNMTTDGSKSDVITLTAESFNREISQRSHFVMFYDPR